MKNNTPGNRYVIAIVIFLVVGLALCLSLSEKKKDDLNFPVVNLSSMDSSEISRGVRLFSFVNDKEYAFVVTSMDLPDSEGFSFTKPAPFSIQDAITSASNALPEYVPADDIPNWFLASVTLTHCMESKWYYIVEYKPRSARVGLGGSANQIRLPVMFNGEIPEGVERGNQKKRIKDFRMAAESLGITPEQLFQRELEAEEEFLRCNDLGFLSDVGSQVLEFNIPSEQLDKLDSVELNQPLPFSIHEAVDVALTASRLYIPVGERSRWKISEVSLIRWGLSEKWYYRVSFNVKDVVNMPTVKQLVIPVLMNGETVKGQRVKTSL